MGEEILEETKYGNKLNGVDEGPLEEHAMRIRACLDLGPRSLVNEGQYVSCGIQMGPQGH